MNNSNNNNENNGSNTEESTVDASQRNEEKEQEIETEEERGIEELTVVITTSAVQSHPSTELIEEVINSFKQCKGLYYTKKIIICDGFIPSHTHKSSFKQGKISSTTAENYTKYIEKLKEKKWPNNDVIVRSSRKGFASNVRYCLKHKVSTKFVLIVQHDMKFIRGVDLRSIVEKMMRSDVNYIGFPSPSVMKLYTTYTNLNLFRNQILSFIPLHLSSPILPSHLENNPDNDSDNDDNNNDNNNTNNNDNNNECNINNNNNINEEDGSVDDCNQNNNENYKEKNGEEMMKKVVKKKRKRKKKAVMKKAKKKRKKRRIKGRRKWWEY